MKRFISFLAVLAVVVMMSSAVFAAVSTETAKSAFMQFEGGTISFSADLYNWNSTYTGTSTGTIAFSSDGITLGSSEEQFKCADVYALIQSTITAASGKVWVYQNNKSNDSPYVATNPRHDGENTIYSGLVKGGSNGGDGNFAPLSAYYRPLSVAKAQITTLPTSFPFPDPTGNYGVYNFKDISDSNYIEKDDYMLVATSKGNFVGFGAPDFVKEPVVMFFGAKFTNVLGGESYGTTTITFVSEVE